MKYFKLSILAFIISITIHSVGVKADNYMSFLDIKIPNSSSYYESGEVAKTIDNNQYYKNKTTKGGLMGTSNVIVRTNSSAYGISNEMQVNEGQEKTWGENAYNSFSGNYKIRIRSTSIFTSAQHWGHWMLDGRLAGTL